MSMTARAAEIGFLTWVTPDTASARVRRGLRESKDHRHANAREGELCHDIHGQPSFPPNARPAEPLYPTGRSRTPVLQPDRGDVTCPGSCYRAARRPRPSPPHR